MAKYIGNVPVANTEKAVHFSTHITGTVSAVITNLGIAPFDGRVTKVSAVLGTAMAANKTMDLNIIGVNVGTRSTGQIEILDYAGLATDGSVIITVNATASAGGTGGSQDWDIETDNATTASNLATELNTTTTVKAWSVGAVVYVEWDTPGVAGDAIVFTKAGATATDARLTINGAGTLIGGTDGVTVNSFAEVDFLDGTAEGRDLGLAGETKTVVTHGALCKAGDLLSVETENMDSTPGGAALTVTVEYSPA